MPYNRPGNIKYRTNDTGGTLVHDQPVALHGAVGKVIKQKPVGWDQGLAAQNVIQVNEKVAVLVKGIVEVDSTPISSAADGDPVYITAGNVLTTTATSNTKFGRVAELPGDGRGVPTGRVRIDLDAKDSF